MSSNIATPVVRGANSLLDEATAALDRALSDSGPKAAVAFPETVGYLPTILALTGTAVEKLGDLPAVLTHARQLLARTSVGAPDSQTPRESLGTGMAALLAAETIEALHFLNHPGPAGLPVGGPIADAQLCSSGIRLVDGRVPAYALVIGCAASNQLAVEIVRELQNRNILTFLSGSARGRNIIQQLQEEGAELGFESLAVPLGFDAISAIYGLGFACRLALRFGGLKPGMSQAVLHYSKERLPAFVLCLGAVNDVTHAMAAGAGNFGLPIVADTTVAEISPRSESHEGDVISIPSEAGVDKNERQRAVRLVRACVEARGLKIRGSSSDSPVPYGPGFEGEIISETDLSIEFGAPHARAFEFMLAAKLHEVSDGRIEVLGPDLVRMEQHGSGDLGIVVKVAGRRMQPDIEPLLEHQIHRFLDGALGIQHIGRRDHVRIRISKAAASRGVSLQTLGQILHARFHEDFGEAAEGVQVTIISEPKLHAEWLAKAQASYNLRDRRRADFVDAAVDEFYACAQCQSVSPKHVCVVSPQRPGMCGSYGWLECKASFSLNPDGPIQPVKLGRALNLEKGYWEGTNESVRDSSQGAIGQVSMYSMMDDPMTACPSFECIAMLIPEANGVMIVSREDSSMTPAGMTFSTLACIAAGGMQTPGVMGVASDYLVSPKFISADGGFKRIVWMSSGLKDNLAEELKVVCQREGDPDLLDRIADERGVKSVDELVTWLKTHGHPAVSMAPMF